MTLEEVQKQKFLLYQFDELSESAIPPKEQVPPTLRHILDLALQLNSKVFLEIKPMGLFSLRKACRQVALLFREMDLHHIAIVISFSSLALYFVRSFDPSIHTAFLSESFSFGIPYFESIFAYYVAVFLGCSMIGLPYKFVDKRFVDLWSSLGFGVYTWTVKRFSTCNFF